MSRPALAAIEDGAVHYPPQEDSMSWHYASPGAFCLLNVLPLTTHEELSYAKAVPNPVLILDADYHVGNGD